MELGLTERTQKSTSVYICATVCTHVVGPVGIKENMYKVVDMRKKLYMKCKVKLYFELCI